VNEFGELDIDADLLRNCPLDCDDETQAGSTQQGIYELANGCICCTVEEEFLPVMQELVKRRDDIDHILIETSGLALPKPLLKAFEWPAIRSRITVDGVVALADAEAVAAGRFAPNVEAVEAQRLADDSLDHDTPLSEVFEDQISCADIILLTKADLVYEAQMQKARDVIAAESPRKVSVVAISEGDVDPRVILGLEAAAEDDLDARPSHHDGHDDHEHDDFDTIMVDLPEIADTDMLKSAIEGLARSHNVLRVKGYIAVEGKPMRMLVQAVGDRVRMQYDTPWGGRPRVSSLVVIAEHDRIDPPAIRAALGV